ncbi:MAG: hypothetical protein JNJ54_30075 [Myxococcaceae bacterium]|nr:hypothetical protein [Myxococcaceae bacterium]
MLDLILDGRQQELDKRRAELARRPSAARSLVQRLEAEVAKAPHQHITFDSTGHATVAGAGHRFDGGRFSVLSLGALHEAALLTRESAAPRVKLSVLAGADPLTDVGLLQATAPEGSLFQVASQFNCLEAPDAMLVPVHRYFTDPTQGPRASISAFPGTLVRHYAAPASDGSRFVQTDARQLDLLANALPASVGRVESGYLLSQNLKDFEATARTLEARFDDLCVGVHERVEVVFGANWDGPVNAGQRIAQVFTSTFAGGGYSNARTEGPLLDVCRVLLRAAYAGTLFAAASLGTRTVVLTLIGGGVFGNPHPLIWESILWAVEQTDALVHGPLHVVLNGREVEQTLGRDRLIETTRARGGVFVRVDQGHLEVR